eukprot:308729_1
MSMSAAFQRLIDVLRTQRAQEPENDVTAFKWMNLQQKLPDTVMVVNEILPCGFPNPGKIIIIGDSDWNECFLFDYHSKSSNKYKSLGDSPFLRKDWEISRRIVAVPTYTMLECGDSDFSEFIESQFIVFDTEQFNSAYYVTYSNNKLNWKKIATNEMSELQTKEKMLHWDVVGLHSDAVICGEMQQKLLILPEYDLDMHNRSWSEMDVIVVDISYECYSYRIKNVFKSITKSKLVNSILVPITKNHKIIPNEFIFFTEEQLSHRKISATMVYKIVFDEQKFEQMVNKTEHLYFNNDNIIQLKELNNGGFLGSLALKFKQKNKTYGTLFNSSYIIFNNYLLLFLGDDTIVSDGDLRNEVHIFSFTEMKWIAYFTFPFLFNHSKTTLNCGVIHFLLYWEQTVKHCTLDIGNLFNYRQQIYQSVCEGLNYLEINDLKKKIKYL